eukprot:3367470-Pleurochrysis_carterae.AAC.1
MLTPHRYINDIHEELPPIYLPKGSLETTSPATTGSTATCSEPARNSPISRSPQVRSTLGVVRCSYVELEEGNRQARSSGSIELLLLKKQARRSHLRHECADKIGYYAHRDLARSETTDL